LRELSRDFLKQLLIDDPRMEVASEYLNKIHAGYLARKDVPVAKTKANMVTHTKETAAVTSKEPA